MFKKKTKYATITLTNVKIPHCGTLFVPYQEKRNRWLFCLKYRDENE